MEVICAKSSGLCFGVKNAVDSANRMIEQRAPGERLIMLGELTHNAKVVGDLTDRGFEIVQDASDVPENSTVIIRAHGVSPDQKEILKSKGCKVIDCTCPFVQKIHNIVREAASEGKDIIITGGKGHPEVTGICGEAPGKVTVISSVEEMKALDRDFTDTLLISQTTFSSEIFKEICAIVENKIAKNLIFDTICSTTGVRQSEAARISAEADVMIVIGSSHSSNTKKLYDICSGHCVRTYLVSDADEVGKLIADGYIRPDDRVGVTAGASTPEVIILEVVRRMDENKNEIMTNQGEADIDFQEYVEGIAQLRRNAIVKGAITSADADYVYVDVRDKSEGKIPRREFASDPDFDLEAAIASKAEVTVVVKSIILR